MKRLVFLMIPLFFLLYSSTAQDTAAKVRFDYRQAKTGNETMELVITAHVGHPGVELYGMETPKNKSVFSMIAFDSSAKKYLKDSLTEKGKLIYGSDTVLNAAVSFVTDSVQWVQAVKIKRGTVQ